MPPQTLRPDDTLDVYLRAALAGAQQYNNPYSAAARALASAPFTRGVTDTARLMAGESQYQRETKRRKSERTADRLAKTLETEREAEQEAQEAEEEREAATLAHERELEKIETRATEERKTKREFSEDPERAFEQKRKILDMAIKSATDGLGNVDQAKVQEYYKAYTQLFEGGGVRLSPSDRDSAQPSNQAPPPPMPANRTDLGPQSINPPFPPASSAPPAGDQVPLGPPRPPQISQGPMTGPPSVPPLSAQDVSRAGGVSSLGGGGNTVAPPTLPGPQVPAIQQAMELLYQMTNNPSMSNELLQTMLSQNPQLGAIYNQLLIEAPELLQRGGR